jgi:release factor glutamine methyltransferase
MTVYEPAEDSFLLKNYISELELEGKKVLDMGTGSGFIALEMAEKGAEVTAVDKNLEAVKTVDRKAAEKEIEIEARESDLFENVEQKFDLIAFNPPYLPGEKGVGDEEIWRGGEKGTELTERFLENIDSYLTEEGYAVVILSSRADHERITEKYELEILRTEKLWFETLFLARYK